MVFDRRSPYASQVSDSGLKIQGMGFEVVEVDEFKGGDVGGGQDDRGRNTGIECFFPAEYTETPAVAGIEPWKAELGHGGAEVVALYFTEVEKFLGHLGAEDV